jgi:hypothetical protein
LINQCLLLAGGTAHDACCPSSRPNLQCLHTIVPCSLHTIVPCRLHHTEDVLLQ